MADTEFEFRRVNVNELEQLRGLWKAGGIYSMELEKRFTEFQVAVDSEGRLKGAMALQIGGKQGRIHSEVAGLGAHRESLREPFWNRMKKLAESHGLFRLWAPEGGEWEKQGFKKPDDDSTKTGRKVFGDSIEKYLMVQLREEPIEKISLEAEFDLFQAANQEERERLLGQARTVKSAALLILAGAMAVLMIVIVFAAFLK